MEQVKEAKEVKMVFCDYNADSFALANAKISNVNLYKKTNKLELFLLSDKLIDINEIEKFESYIKKRFNIKEVSLKITLPEEDRSNDIKNDWKKILAYLSKKIPVIKAFVKNSIIEIKDTELNINLYFKGKSLLEKQGINTYISNFINDIYANRYKVNFIEEDVNQTELQFTKANDDIIKEFAVNSAKAVKKNAEELVQGEETKQKNEYTKTQGTNTNFSEKTVQYKNNVGGSNQNAPSENVFANRGKATPDDPNLILGRNTNIKEQLIKIEDIGMDTTDAQITGEIVNLPDPTELKKSGKFLVSFDVYDGTSTITCKAFVTPDKLDNVISRLKVGSGVKVGGKAGFDNLDRKSVV